MTDNDNAFLESLKARTSAMCQANPTAGDLNGDGKVNFDDAILLAKVCFKVKDYQGVTCES